MKHLLPLLFFSFFAAAQDTPKIDPNTGLPTAGKAEKEEKIGFIGSTLIALGLLYGVMWLLAKILDKKFGIKISDTGWERTSGGGDGGG